MKNMPSTFGNKMNGNIETGNPRMIGTPTPHP